MDSENVRIIPADGVGLPADLDVPERARGLVVFAHGSGSSRLSPRNRAVAAALRADGGFGTLLFDLLTPQEDELYRNRFEIGLLARRLAEAVRWAEATSEARGLPIGLFGASTGAAAALVTAAELGGRVRAIVSRGGRPDLAGDALARVTAPTLLIVGGLDDVVIGLNREALAVLGAAVKELRIVPGATHLFEEPGTLERVVELTSDWFGRHLR